MTGVWTRLVNKDTVEGVDASFGGKSPNSTQISTGSRVVYHPYVFCIKEERGGVFDVESSRTVTMLIIVLLLVVPSSIRNLLMKLHVVSPLKTVSTSYYEPCFIH